MYNIAGLKLVINSYQDPMIRAFVYGSHGKIIHLDAASILVWNGIIATFFRYSSSWIAGHSANIFSAKFMPATSDSVVISAAADSEVRVFDVNGSNNHGQLRHVYTCHSASVKRIAIDNSPFEFMTCAEDGKEYPKKKVVVHRIHICIRRNGPPLWFTSTPCLLSAYNQFISGRTTTFKTIWSTTWTRCKTRMPFTFGRL